MSERYINRELSWLKFNERVLEEAGNPAHPLLERLRFLSISGNNLDEFFMVRVAGLIGQLRQGIEQTSPDGLTPAQQLAEIEKSANELIRHQQSVWEELRPQLEGAGISVLEPEDLDKSDLTWLREHFQAEIFPLLTPQAIDPAHPFPFIPNLGLSIILDLERRSGAQRLQQIVMLPPTVNRFVRLPGEEGRFVLLEGVILHFLDIIFPGHDCVGAGTFRIIRDSDIEVEEEAEDLVRFFKSAIKRRRRGQVIRLELSATIGEDTADLLHEELGVSKKARAGLSGFTGIANLEEMVDEPRPDLKFPVHTPRFPERIREHDGDCFAAIRSKDFVVHHPYESFDVVVAFLEQAARDPDVLAIKQTLYRAGRQSRIIRALIDAADAGKSVTAVVELKARFDEEQNLKWASALERAGVQVIYGFIEWKTHAKISMVVRHEVEGVRTYCHFGTGNYHPVTAKIYTDLSYFTDDAAVARDAAKIFNYITGYVAPDHLEKITISPLDMRRELMEMIDREIANARDGKPAALWAKMNSLVDEAIIEKLYAASNAGVQIDLIIRGICCLRPGIADMSENIRVKSVVGRFLEHSRIWAFANGKELPSDEAIVYISSADWMPRNLNRRVEYMLPMENPTVHDQVLDQVMLANLLDNQQSWQLYPDGEYERIVPGPDEEAFNLHHYFMNNPSLSGRGKALKKSKSVPQLKLKRKKKEAK